MKQTLSFAAILITFVMFALSFYMATYVPLVHDKMGFLMLMSFSAMLFTILIALEEKSRFWVWIEGIGMMLWMGVGVFFGIHYIQGL